MADKLGSGDQFPALTINSVNDGEITLPSAIDSDYAVVIFYRGHW